MLVTFPPPLTVNVPLNTFRVPLLVQVAFDPVTVTAPVPRMRTGGNGTKMPPIDPAWSLTDAPAVMCIVPLPASPTNRKLVTVKSPRKPLLTTSSVPESPESKPRMRFLACALFPKIWTVPPLLTRPSVAEVGTPADHLVPMNQLPVPSTQMVCAEAVPERSAGTITSTATAIRRAAMRVTASDPFTSMSPSSSGIEGSTCRRPGVRQRASPARCHGVGAGQGLCADARAVRVAIPASRVRSSEPRRSRRSSYRNPCAPGVRRD